MGKPAGDAGQGWRGDLIVEELVYFICHSESFLSYLLCLFISFLSDMFLNCGLYCARRQWTKPKRRKRRTSTKQKPRYRGDERRSWVRYPNHVHYYAIAFRLQAYNEI